jgi:hypothetical protein
MIRQNRFRKNKVGFLGRDSTPFRKEPPFRQESHFRKEPSFRKESSFRKEPSFRKDIGTDYGKAGGFSRVQFADDYGVEEPKKGRLRRFWEWLKEKARGFFRLPSKLKVFFSVVILGSLSFFLWWIYKKVTGTVQRLKDWSSGKNNKKKVKFAKKNNEKEEEEEEEEVTKEDETPEDRRKKIKKEYQRKFERYRKKLWETYLGLMKNKKTLEYAQAQKTKAEQDFQRFHNIGGNAEFEEDEEEEDAQGSSIQAAFIEDSQLNKVKKEKQDNMESIEGDIHLLQNVIKDDVETFKKLVDEFTSIFGKEKAKQLQQSFLSAKTPRLK